MSFSGQKITDAEIAAYGVQSQPSKLEGAVKANQKVFDKLIDDVVQAKLNGLIDELLAQTAAGQIGCAVTGMTATDVGAALLELLTGMQSITQGAVADGSITTAKIADANVTGAKLTGILPANVGIKIGTSTPTTADISEGQIYLKYST